MEKSKSKYLTAELNEIFNENFNYDTNLFYVSAATAKNMDSQSRQIAMDIICLGSFTLQYELSALPMHSSIAYLF